jgi:hypothetical protein
LTASRKIAGNEVIVLFQAREILHVEFAVEKSRCLVQGNFRFAIRLPFCESIIFDGIAESWKICRFFQFVIPANAGIQ